MPGHPFTAINLYLSRHKPHREAITLIRTASLLLKPRRKTLFRSSMGVLQVDLLQYCRAILAVPCHMVGSWQPGVGQPYQPSQLFASDAWRQPVIQKDLDTRLESFQGWQDRCQVCGCLEISTTTASGVLNPCGRSCTRAGAVYQRADHPLGAD